MAILHPTRRIQALLPLYAQRFSCIGSDCEDTCCAGWKVPIDKKTFDAYKESKNPRLAERFELQIKQPQNPVSDKNYAHIDLSPTTGDCPMLEERLCAIHQELGEDKLSNTCFTYPRTTTAVGDFHQQSLTLSCPEAARLALLAPDAFEFSQSDISVREDAVSRLVPPPGISMEQINAIRFFCIQLIRGDRLETWQKLAVLGLFCESLSAAITAGEYSRIPQIMESTKALIESGECLDLFSGMQPLYDIQAMTFANLWHVKSKGKVVSRSQTAVDQAIAQGIGADPQTGDVTVSVLTERYRQGIKRLPEALKEVPFLLENYVVNEMWRECFPFAEMAPYAHYLRLVIRFGQIRFMLATQCSQENSLPSHRFMAQVVQTFCRRYQHDTQFTKNVNNWFTSSGWNELHKIYRLLII